MGPYSHKTSYLVLCERAILAANSLACNKFAIRMIYSYTVHCREHCLKYNRNHNALLGHCGMQTNMWLAIGKIKDILTY